MKSRIVSLRRWAATCSSRAKKSKKKKQKATMAHSCTPFRVTAKNSIARLRCSTPRGTFAKLSGLCDTRIGPTPQPFCQTPVCDCKPVSRGWKSVRLKVVPNMACTFSLSKAPQKATGKMRFKAFHCFLSFIQPNCDCSRGHSQFHYFQGSESFQTSEPQEKQLVFKKNDG